MKVTWLGHDAFLFETAEGTKILSDPYVCGSYNGAVGYKPIEEHVDMVFSTHEHADHGGYDTLPGKPQVITGTGEHKVEGIAFRGIATFHDKSGGSERGTNTVFVFSADGLNICHLGDLGHTLTPEQVAEIGPVDLLFVPVGGCFTIDHGEAWEVAKAMRPKIVVPMHYKTEVLGFPLDRVDRFLQDKKNVEHTRGDSFDVSADSLPEEMKILVVKEHRL